MSRHFALSAATPNRLSDVPPPLRRTSAGFLRCYMYIHSINSGDHEINLFVNANERNGEKNIDRKPTKGKAPLTRVQYIRCIAVIYGHNTISMLWGYTVCCVKWKLGRPISVVCL